MLYRKIHTKPKSKNYEPRAAIIYLLIMRHILSTFLIMRLNFYPRNFLITGC